MTNSTDISSKKILRSQLSLSLGRSPRANGHNIRQQPWRKTAAPLPSESSKFAGAATQRQHDLRCRHSTPIAPEIVRAKRCTSHQNRPVPMLTPPHERPNERVPPSDRAVTVTVPRSSHHQGHLGSRSPFCHLLFQTTRISPGLKTVRKD